MNEVIKAALRLDRSQGYIVTANISMRDKVFICRTAASAAFKPSDWKERAEKTLIRIGNLSADRNMIAHAIFCPDDEGDGVRFLRVIAKGKLVLPDVVWPISQFKSICQEIMALRAELETIESGFREPIDLPSMITYADYFAKRHSRKCVGWGKASRLYHLPASRNPSRDNLAESRETLWRDWR